VDIAEAYQSVVPSISRDGLEQIFAERPVDMIVFTSSSTVSNLAEILRPKPIAEFLGQTVVAAIGPITTRTAEEHGLHVLVQPKQYNISSLVTAILDFYAK
jgi:uroporphyrinogen III methyltransferase/synthase